MGNLFDEMEKIVNRYVKAYKDDFECDKAEIYSKGGGMRYVWYIREEGTQLMDWRFITVCGSDDYLEAVGWLRSAVKGYIVDVDEVLPGEAFGGLSELDLKDFEGFLRTLQEDKLY